MNIYTYEIRLKVYTLIDIPVTKVLSTEASFFDSVLALEEKWLNYHKKNQFKYYCFNGLYPIERDGIYKKGQVYTIIIRTVNMDLAKYFSKTLGNYCTKELKGLAVENRVIPKKVIGELYTLTPVIQKSNEGYWRDKMTINDFEHILFGNMIKKYNQFMGQKMNEDFQFYTSITFLNKKPISIEYKGIHLLGDKIHLKIDDNEKAQELAYFLLGTGIGECNARGGGFCNYRWL